MLEGPNVTEAVSRNNPQPKVGNFRKREVMGLSVGKAAGKDVEEMVRGTRDPRMMGPAARQQGNFPGASYRHSCFGKPVAGEREARPAQGDTQNPEDKHDQNALCRKPPQHR